MSRSVGLLGGAFNPPHIGHLVLAQEALWGLGLDELILIPTGVAPHKRIEPEPGPAIRLELAEAAVADLDRVRVSDVEVARDGPSYAYRSLELLADELPGSDFTFVMGADVAVGLASWRHPQRVLELARIAVAMRPGVSPEAVEEVLDGLGDGPGAEFIAMPAIGVSSTLIRERVALGRPLRWLVPDAVAERIAERGLYGRAVVS
jgi:nicotinate-nucleotide adenylyltransferase